jgi:hypothetical protein
VPPGGWNGYRIDGTFVRRHLNGLEIFVFDLDHSIADGIAQVDRRRSLENIPEWI